jgi:hypothetical protein
MRLIMSTEERRGESLILFARFATFNCPGDVGLREVEQLAGPYIPDAERARFRDFLRRPRLERTDEQKARYGVMQNDMFGPVNVLTEFDAANSTNDRIYTFDTMTYPPAAKLVPQGFHHIPCDAGVQ